MSHVYHKLFYHYVWATKERIPLIEDDTRPSLVQLIEEECRKRGTIPIACNAMPDHVHLLVNMPPKIAPATFIGEIKGASSYKHNHELATRHWMKWQDGYGVVTIREGEIRKLIRYIDDQQLRHATGKVSHYFETMAEPEP